MSTAHKWIHGSSPQTGIDSDELQTVAHEPKWSQRFGGQFKLLEVVEREIRSSRGQVETLVADLDYSQHPVRRVEHRRRHQLVDCSRVKFLFFGFFPAGLDALKDAGVLHPREVVEQLNFSGDRSVCGDGCRTGNWDRSRSAEFKGTEKL